jgi:hypothetical protein
MFTLEQELDAVTDELNQEIRRLHQMESAPYEGRACDTEVLRRSIVTQREKVNRLHRDREGVIADLIARDAA